MRIGNKCYGFGGVSQVSRLNISWPPHVPPSGQLWLDFRPENRKANVTISGKRAPIVFWLRPTGKNR